jgi:Ca2+-binding EF-hand superfamily protein
VLTCAHPLPYDITLSIPYQDVKRELLEMFDMFSKDGALPVANALKVVNAQGFEVDDATLADIREMHDLPADAYSIQQWLVFAIEVMIRPQAEGSRPAEDKAFAEARRAFSMFDVDDDGFVSIEEITELVNKVDAGNGAEATAGDRDEATELIKKMDRTNDGKVNLSEFILYAMSSDIHTRSKSFARDLSMLDKEV